MIAESQLINETPGEETRVWETIEAFETILEMFPEDTNALESLAAAYEQTGDAIQAQEMVLRLARIYADAMQWRKVMSLTDRLLALNPADEQAHGLRSQAEAGLMRQAPRGDQASPEPQALAADFQGELELALFLFQNDLLTEGQYDQIMAGLTNSRFRSDETPVRPLMLEINAMSDVRVDQVIDCLARETGTPYVDIMRYENKNTVMNLLRAEDRRNLGALPFANVGDELMVAVLNPLSSDIRETIAKALRTKIHFYLTSPTSFLAVSERA